MQNPTLSLSPKIIRKYENQILCEQETGGAVSLAREHFECSDRAQHSCRNGDQWFFIESGTFDFKIGEDDFRLEKHDFVFTPRGAMCFIDCRSGGGGALIHGILNLGVEYSRKSTPHPQVGRKSEAKYFEIFSNAIWILAASAQFNDRFCAVIMETPSLDDSPWTAQHNTSKFFLILSGRYEFQIGDARVQVEPGDGVWAPRGMDHSFRVVSNISGQLLVFSTPGGFDDFIRSAPDNTKAAGRFSKLLLKSR